MDSLKLPACLLYVAVDVLCYLALAVVGLALIKMAPKP